MCFGGKNEKEDDTPAPRRPSVENGKKGGAGAGGQSVSRPRSVELRESNQRQEQYAPPPGPPPVQSNSSDYAPPPGPPPGQSNNSDYAPPPGPPPTQRHDDFAPPSGPPPGHQQNNYAPPSGPPPGHGDYAPPAGPPPAHSGGDFAPPPGPPPGLQRKDDYAPPPGPPPTHQGQSEYAPPPGPPPGASSQNEYAPPPGPPPKADDDWMKPPPFPPSGDSKGDSSKQHNWETAVPDTSLFPPPPAIFSGFETSPAHNSTEEEAEAGEQWCARNPFVGPQMLDHTALRAIETGNIRLMEPPGFNGRLEWLGLGHWQVSTTRNSPDRCFIAYPPLYATHQHQPLQTGRPKTIYYEVKLRKDCPGNTLAIGFTTLPYPSFRLPGWHRGSLAVHGDDGRKYINDLWGGKTFTEEFKKGDTYGIGMKLSPPTAGVGAPAVEVFFTKNGRPAGGWDLHEEIDAEQDGSVEGMEGFHDLSAAVGTFEGVSLEVVFDPAKWLFKGVN